MMRSRLAIVLLLGLGACADNNTQSLLITQANIPETECVLPAMSSVFRGYGTYDLFFLTGDYLGPGPVGGYHVYPSMTNTLDPGSSGAVPRAFTIQVTGAEVTLLDSSGGVIDPTRMMPQFKVLKAGDAMSLDVLAIRPDVLGALTDGDLVFAHIQGVGERDGQEIRSNTIEFPIYICNGCLFYDEGPCTEVKEAGTVDPCNLAQDAVAVCCEHSTRGLLCPAEPESVTTP
jgi:hypothetical protein